MLPDCDKTFQATLLYTQCLNQSYRKLCAFLKIRNGGVSVFAACPKDLRWLGF